MKREAMERLMPAGLDDGYEEEWKVVINTGGKYTLNRLQALILRQAMATGKRIVQFQTFTISIPYVAEFYRERRFLKGAKQLPKRASERPYKPIPKEKWEKLKEKIYKKFFRA